MILRGAVGRQEVLLSRWNHSSKRLFGELPVGGGVIYEQGDALVSEVSYLMDIPAAREAYETVKGLGPIVQWSIAHRPVKWDFLQDGEMIHRHLAEIMVVRGVPGGHWGGAGYPHVDGEIGERRLPPGPVAGAATGHSSAASHPLQELDMTELELKRLQEEYLRKLREAEDVRKPFEESGEIMPSDKNQQLKKLLDDADGIQTRIESGKADLEEQERLARHRAFAQEPATTLEFPGQPTDDAPGAGGDVEVLRRAGFGEWLKHGGMALSSGWQGRGIEEFKALQADSDAAGGYLIAPTMVVRDLIKNIDDMVYMRTMATVHTISAGQSLGAPTLETDFSDPLWTSELQTGDEDTIEPFGRRELNPQPLAKRVKMSNKLLRAPGIDAEAFWLGRMAYKFGTAQENAYLNGHGANQPLGTMVAHADGIPASRDVSEDNEATAITAKGLINAQYSIKSAYWPRLRWMFHRGRGEAGSAVAGRRWTVPLAAQHPGGTAGLLSWACPS